METLYVIKLQNNKWYIGKTKQYNHRMDQHVVSNGAHWTKFHGPSQKCSAKSAEILLQRAENQSAKNMIGPKT